MNNEKVKEIKDNITICTTKIGCNECSLLPIMASTNCRNKLLADALSLINELESENERLNRLREVDYKTMTTLRQADTELNECMDEMKDRIAELEKENVVKLKQFAERLKEEAIPNGEFVKELYIVNVKKIDETLKEFLEDKSYVSR